MAFLKDLALKVQSMIDKHKKEVTVRRVLTGVIS